LRSCRKARTRIEFLAGEADRWRNATSLKKWHGLGARHASGPAHYIDLEISGLRPAPATLPAVTYDFAADIVKARAAHPERFQAMNPDNDADHTARAERFSAVAITENYEKIAIRFQHAAALEKFGGTANGNWKMPSRTSFM